MSRPKLCIELFCNKSADSRGRCRKHYQQWLRLQWKRSGHLTPETQSDLPNPWWNQAPTCPQGCSPTRVYLWADDGPYRWLCVNHQLLFNAEVVT